MTRPIDAELISLAGTVADPVILPLAEAVVALQRDGGREGKWVLQNPLIEVLMGDHVRFDVVIRALMVRLELTYIEALDEMYRAYDQAGAWQPIEPDPDKRVQVTLAQVIKPVTLAQLHETIADEYGRMATPAGEPQVDVDDDGHALLPAAADPDALLADPLAPKRAYRQALEQGIAGRYGPDDGRPVGEGEAYKLFELEWRTYTNNRWDLVGTLALEQRREEIEWERVQGSVGAVQRHEKRLAYNRAEKAQAHRDLAKTLESQADALETRSLVNPPSGSGF